MTPTRGTGIAAGLALSALLVLTMDGDTATDTTHAPAAPCTALVWDAEHADAWYQLRSEGWQGMATDGTDDILYSPACHSL
jgi:hypothetical protein